MGLKPLLVFQPVPNSAGVGTGGALRPLQTRTVPWFYEHFRRPTHSLWGRSFLCRAGQSPVGDTPLPRSCTQFCMHPAPHVHMRRHQLHPNPVRLAPGWRSGREARAGWALFSLGSGNLKTECVRVLEQKRGALSVLSCLQLTEVKTPVL